MSKTISRRLNALEMGDALTHGNRLPVTLVWPPDSAPEAQAACRAEIAKHERRGSTVYLGADEYEAFANMVQDFV